MTTYKGYTGSIEDDTQGGWHGRLAGIDDLVTYQAPSALDLNLAFRAAVDHYLTTCHMLGRKPDRTRMSRNQREGRYVGQWLGRHLRTNRLQFIVGGPYGDLAWSLASKRAGEPLPYPKNRRGYLPKNGITKFAARWAAAFAFRERQAFKHWRAMPKTGRITGWRIWCASLAQRGTPDTVIRRSRTGFDAWLLSMRPRDWTEFDAWEAARQWRTRTDELLSKE